MELPEQKGSSRGSKLLAYSLGDFVTASDSNQARNGCILSVTVEKERGSVRITDLRCIPTYSAAPSDELKTRDYEVLDTLAAISFYQQGYYDRVSDELYERLVSALDKLKEQTGIPDSIAAQ